MSALVECEGLVHIYRTGPKTGWRTWSVTGSLEVVALQGLDLEVQEGEMVAVVGASGSGKTTLMNVLAAAEVPSAGAARVAGWDVAKLTPRQRDRYRREVVGYAWQDAGLNLTRELSALDNLQLPLLAAGQPWRRRREAADRLLGALRLDRCASLLPAQMSGGEQQRLALGVAMANEPRLLLADEPTAELDRATADAILADVRQEQAERGLTVLMVTHDPLAARYADRVIRIRDGRTSAEQRRADEELVVIDRAGRLQIPRGLLDASGLGGRARVHLEGGRLVIEPAQEPPPGPGEPQ